MIARHFTHCMLKPEDIKPSNDRLKIVGTFNPGVIDTGEQTLLIVRVAEQPVETRAGYLPSPRIDPHEGYCVDWLEADQTDSLSDSRVYIDKRTGKIRLRFISHFRVFHSRDGKTIDNYEARIIYPEGGYEEYGIEDSRITEIGGTYYITYVGASGHSVATCLMSTTDFAAFKRHGVIFCPDNKDVVLFPERIVGDYIAFHRPMPMMTFTSPKIWLARSPDLLHWGGHEQLITGNSAYLRDRVGIGTPPIRTDKGWLTLYHGSAKAHGETGAGVYTAGALLLDIDNPKAIVAQSPEPIMTPIEDFERVGFVNNVVFPTAVVERDDAFHVYYGAADRCVGVTAFGRDELLDAMDGV